MHAVSTTGVSIKWSKVDGANGYELYRASGNSDFKHIKTIKHKTKATLYGLSKGTKYTYKVKAYRRGNDYSAETFSAEKVVKTPSRITRGMSGFSKTNAGKLISVCRSKLGCPYQLGAAGPWRFDCSGYVYWTYKKSGVSSVKVPRTSAQGLYSSLRNYYIGTNLSKAQPGDIILFSNGGSKSGIRHAAIYYGNGQLIHASNPSTGVCITGVGWSGGQSSVAAIIRLPHM